MPTFSPGIFQVGHVFQQGDLPFYSTSGGNASDPYLVTYTVFWLNPQDPNPVQVGAAGRTPLHAATGEYYASGIAGTCGQPGNWYVEWTYQETSGSPSVKVVFPFKVFDSAQYCVPCCGQSGGWA